MKECIEREAALEGICLDCAVQYDCKDEKCSDYMRIKRIPAADVREAKRGEWKQVVGFTGVEAFGFKETMIVGWGCNVCGFEVDVSEGDYNFCPNCGAEMKGEADGK